MHRRKVDNFVAATYEGGVKTQCGFLPHSINVIKTSCLVSCVRLPWPVDVYTIYPHFSSPQFNIKHKARASLLVHLPFHT